MRRTGRFILAGAGVILLAGCGIQQVQPSGPTAGPTLAPVPSPTAIPTIAVTGGSVAASIRGTTVTMSLFRTLQQITYKDAISNGSPLTAQQANDQTLNQIIQYVVSIQKARSLGVGPTAKDVASQLSKDIKSGGGKKLFDQRLKAAGYTQEVIHFLVAGSIAQKNVIKKMFPNPTVGRVATARQILVSAKKPISKAEAFFTNTVTPTKDKCTGKILSYSAAKTEAKKLLNELRAGKGFAKLATKCSDDLYSSTTGGKFTGPLSTNLLYPYTEGLAPNLERAIFQGKVGAYQLLGSIDGWHVIQVTTRNVERYPKAVQKTTGQSLPAMIATDHFQAWLNTASQLAYAHTKVYERLG